MANDRFRTALLRSELTQVELAVDLGVDPKTVGRWLAGRVPHRRHRIAVAARLGEREADLWPDARPDQSPGAPATGEVLGAYAHRSEVPGDLWIALLNDAREQVDLLGYAYPFIFEMTTRLARLISAKTAGGAKVRIALADPGCPHVAERDGLEQLGGTLPGRIRNALNLMHDLRSVPGVEIGLHTVHLYNSMFRFDDQMIVTPHLFRARGYQHPALHLRRCSPFGMFESFAEQFEQVWGTVRVLGNEQ